MGVEEQLNKESALRFFPDSLDKLVLDSEFVGLFKENPLWASTGVFLGFPADDIDFFCKKKGCAGLTQEQLDAYSTHHLCGTGYVPAPENLHKISSVEEFAKFIQPHRRLETPFPSAFRASEKKDSMEALNFMFNISEQILSDPYEELMHAFSGKGSIGKDPILIEAVAKHFPERHEVEKNKIAQKVKLVFLRIYLMKFSGIISLDKIISHF